MIGAGPAGMEAAIVAKKRGHDVTILEKADQVGGTWNVACLPLYKGELVNLIKWQNDELSRLGVEIRLSTEATVDMIKEMNPDEVILATGGKPFIPPIPGADLPHVVQANEILLQNASFGKNVAVLGGGSVGVETAEYMDYCGSKTTIIEMMDDILIGLERETRLMSLNFIPSLIEYLNGLCACWLS